MADDARLCFFVVTAGDGETMVSTVSRLAVLVSSSDFELGMMVAVEELESVRGRTRAPLKVATDERWLRSDASCVSTSR